MRIIGRAVIANDEYMEERLLRPMGVDRHPRPGSNFDNGSGFVYRCLGSAAHDGIAKKYLPSFHSSVLDLSEVPSPSTKLGVLNTDVEEGIC